MDGGGVWWCVVSAALRKGQADLLCRVKWWLRLAAAHGAAVRSSWQGVRIDGFSGLGWRLGTVVNACKTLVSGALRRR